MTAYVNIGLVYFVPTVRNISSLSPIAKSATKPFWIMAMSFDSATNSASNREYDVLQNFLNDDVYVRCCKDYAKDIRIRKKANQSNSEVTLSKTPTSANGDLIEPSPGFLLQADKCGSRVYVNVGVSDSISKNDSTIAETNRRKDLKWPIPCVILPMRRELNVHQVVGKLTEHLSQKDARLVSKDMEHNGLWIYDVIINSTVLDDRADDFKMHTLLEIVEDTVGHYFDHQMKITKFLGHGCYIGGCRTPALGPESMTKGRACAENRRGEETEENSNPLMVAEGKVSKIPHYKIRHINHASLQDYSILQLDNLMDATKSDAIGVTVSLPTISCASHIDANVVGRELVVTTLNDHGPKYGLTVPLPYVVEEEPLKAAFDSATGVLNLELAVVKTVTNLSPVPSTDSGVECGYRTNSDVDNSSESSVDEYFECKNSDDGIRTEGDAEGKASVIRGILPHCEFVQSDAFVWIRFKTANIRGDSLRLTDIVDGRQFAFTFTTLGQSLAPMVFGGRVSTDPYQSDDVTVVGSAAAGDDDRLHIRVTKREKKPWKFVNMGYDDATMQPYPIRETSTGDREKESTLSSEEGPSTDDSETTKAQVDDTKSLSIPTARPRRTSDCFVTGSYPKSILKGRWRCYSDSQVDSSLDLEEDGEEEEDEDDDGWERKKCVRFNDCVSKQVFRADASILGQRLKNQKKAASKKRVRERKLSEGGGGGSSDRSNSETSDLVLSPTEDESDRSSGGGGGGGGNSSESKCRNKRGKKGKSNKRKGKSWPRKTAPKMSDHMIFQLDDS